MNTTDSTFQASIESDRKINEHQNQGEVDLTLDLQKLFAVPANNEDYTSISENLEENKQAVRQKIFHVVDERVLDGIIRTSENHNDSPVSEKTGEETEAQINIKNNWETNVSGTQVGINNRIKMVVDMESNETISTTQAIQNVCQLIAGAKNNVTFSLEQAFQGKEESFVRNAWNRDDESYSTDELPKAA